MRRPLVLPVAEIVARYEAGASVARIGGIVGASETAVIAGLKAAGVTMRGNGRVVAHGEDDAETQP